MFSVAFVGIRLLFSNSIDRHGGLKVTVVSFLIEIVGLLLIWGAALIVAFGVLLILRLLQQQQRRDNAIRLDGV